MKMEHFEIGNIDFIEEGLARATVTVQMPTQLDAGTSIAIRVPVAIPDSCITEELLEAFLQAAVTELDRTADALRSRTVREIVRDPSVSSFPRLPRTEDEKF